MNDLVLNFMDPNYSIREVDSVAQDLDGLNVLVSEGAWKSVMKLAIKLMVGAKTSRDKLYYRFWIILAKIEMKQYDSAQSEFKDIGAFDDLKNNTVDSNGIYSSNVPEQLRLLYAILPFCLSKKDTKLDALFTLLALLKDSYQDLVFDSQILSLLNHSSISPANMILYPENHDKHKSIERLKILIANMLCSQGAYVQALDILSKVLENHPNDIGLLSGTGRIFLQMGNNFLAEQIFNRVETITKEKEDKGNEEWLNAMVECNRAFLALGEGNFSNMLSGFQKANSLAPKNAFIANNLSIGYIYNGNLKKAIKTLEDFLNENPKGYHETTVQNLCTLYDLAHLDSINKKKGLLKGAIQNLPDNFDLSVFKISDLLDMKATKK
uniref:Uncharacterized protein n=1 Tax=Arcella intermedia TaxID=1963864 RepID=A0A6B2L6U9_9EUKA